MTGPSWAQAQRDRLSELLEQQAADPLHTWIGYWNSDAWGRSANSGDTSIERAAPGVIHVCSGPLELCSPRALHATLTPHRWRGARVWVVALHGERHTEDDKCGALRREIIGEVLPEDVVDPSVAARMGIWADMSGANLSRANLSGANLSRANLSRANLSRANLYGANLYGANLSRADMSGADMSGANLYGANLSGAYRGSGALPGLPEQYQIRDGYVCRRES